jgi:hypothetical protein
VAGAASTPPAARIAMRVIGCCAYFYDSCVDGTARDLDDAGVELHLWALDRPRQAVEAHTRGVGLRPKWPLLTALMAQASKPFDYVLFFDDDIALPPHFWSHYLAEVRACGADLSQPALTPDSHASHAITRQDPDCRARITNFIEVGPFVCMTERFYRLTLPYLDPISPLGWGYEAQWTHLAETHGLVQAIIDRCPVRHTRPVGVNYSSETTRSQLERYVQKYGNPMPTPMTHTYLY